VVRGKRHGDLGVAPVIVPSFLGEPRRSGAGRRGRMGALAFPGAKSTPPAGRKAATCEGTDLLHRVA